MILSPNIHFITKIDRYCGFGDDCMAVQFLIHHALERADYEIVEIIYPYLPKKYNDYANRITRLVKLRLHAQKHHPYIKFTILDYATNKVHHIENHQYSILPNHIFLNEIDVSHSYNENNDGWNIRRQFVKKYNTISFYTEDNNIQTFPHYEYKFRALAGWPTFEPKIIYARRHGAMKSTISKTFIPRENYTNLEYKKDKNSLSIIPYCKFLIGPEGGLWHLSRMSNVPYIMILSEYLFKHKIKNIFQLKMYTEVITRQNLLFELTRKISPQAFCFESAYFFEFDELNEKINDWLYKCPTSSVIFLPSIKRRKKYEKIINLMLEHLNNFTNIKTL